MAVSGKITVTVRIGSSTQSAEATVEVRNRGWTWANRAESVYRDGTGTICYNYTPTFGRPNGANLEIGWTQCDVGHAFVQPDSHAPTGDGFAVETVASGPNQGLHFVSSASLHMLRESTYNPGLWPNAPAVQLSDTPPWTQATECGASANWYQFSLCKHADADGFIAGVKAHEGWGSTGHNGHFSAAYDAVTDPANDPMIFLDQEVGEKSITQAEFIARLRDGFYPRAGAADEATKDISNGGHIVTGNWSGIYWGWLDDHFNYYNATI